ncbi:MAG TPA: GNAT family N-acetyltransferase [candidate division Zixibacteria bacterium]|nr:GNAT family N-acetyltransferase [candidate division Zixibacteria bacterium]
MKVEIRDVTEQNIDDLVGLCAPRLKDKRHAQTLKEGGLRKREWIEKALKRFGACAKMAYVEGKAVGLVEFYPMSAFPLLPERDRRTVMITCVFIPDKTLQQVGIGSKLVRTLIEDLKRTPLKSFAGKKAEEVAVGSWGCHAGFPESMPRFQNFFSKNGFKRDLAFPDPTGKGGILVHTL